jgi:hypothetical protein
MAMFENQPPRPAGAPGTVPPASSRIPPPPVRPPMPAQEPEDIFAGVSSAGPKMPAPPPPPPKRGGRRIALVFIVFIILILLAVGGVLTYLSLMRQAPAPPVNLPVVNVPAVNLNAPVAVCGNGVCESTETEASCPADCVVVPALPVLGYTAGADADADGLTDAEETLYGTDSAKLDSDGDTYSDGTELTGLYDPTKGGGALLVNSGLVKAYINSKFGYSVFYPAKWQAKAADNTERLVNFQAGNAENIKVSVEDNADKATLYEWVLAKLPTADLTAYDKKISKGGLDELISPDKLTYYLTKEGQLDKVYVISYTLGPDKVANYLSTLQMMVNGFTLVK